MEGNKRFDLKDVTFLICFTPCSVEDLYNLRCLIKYFGRYFITNLMVWELGQTPHFPQELLKSTVRYKFCQERFPVAQKAKYLNKMIEEVETSIIAIWEINEIVPPDQLYDSVRGLTTNKPDYSYPFNSNCVRYVDRFLLETIVENNENFAGICERAQLRQEVMHEFVGQSVLIGHQVYKNAGRENENISDWIMNCQERRKRFEILGLKLHQAEGILIKIQGDNRISINNLPVRNHPQNLMELLRICKEGKDELMQDIKQWRWVNDFYRYSVDVQIDQSANRKEEIARLYLELNPIAPLPLKASWALSPDLREVLVDMLKENKPQNIVECGSGLSTIICGYMAKRNEIGHVFSLEHHKLFYETTKNSIKLHGLEEYVTLIYAPLTRIMINDKEWLWYDLLEVQRNIDHIDFLIIDGPPGNTQKNARYPAIPVLINHFSEEISIVVDDSNRKEDRESIDRWLLEYPILTSRLIDTEKGSCVLTKTKFSSTI